VGAAEGGGDQAHEHWLGVQRPAGELGVELGADEVGVVGQLEDLHDRLLGVPAREDQAVLLERSEVARIDLEAVAEAGADCKRG
jgi:hypothetical protein